MKPNVAPRLLDVPALGLPTAPACPPGGLAAHEAGHAIVGLALGLPVRAVRVSARGGDTWIGHATQHDHGPIAQPESARAEKAGAYLVARGAIERGEFIETVLAWMATAVAGLAAERMDDVAATRADFDHRRARLLSIVLLGGVAIPLWASRLARAILRAHRDVHAAACTALERDGEIDAGVFAPGLAGTWRPILADAVAHAARHFDADATVRRLGHFLREAADDRPRAGFGRLGATRCPPVLMRGPGARILAPTEA